MGEGGILKELTKALVERGLNAEINYQMQEEKANPTPKRPSNRRNGYSPETNQGHIWRSHNR